MNAICDVIYFISLAVICLLGGAWIASGYYKNEIHNLQQQALDRGYAILEQRVDDNGNEEEKFRWIDPLTR